MLPPVARDAASISSLSSSRRIRKLQGITIVWMVVECSVALTSAWRAHSPALAAFGADSFVELLSAVVVVMQFAPRWALRPSVAARLAGALLLVLACVIAAISIATLVGKVAPDASRSGIAITLCALLIMPLLSRAKRRTAREAGNRALAADAVQSATCAYLAALTLVGLVLNALFRIGWIDPMAALFAIPILLLEARKALQGEVCGCCAPAGEAKVHQG